MSDTTPISRDALGDDLLCPQCGYNLRGLSEYRCPECGQTFDPAELTASVLPWLQRRQIGRLRAYVQTLRLVLVHPARLATEIAHRQPYRDSQSFRWITVALACLPVLFATMANWDGQNQFFYQPPDGGGLGIGFAAIYLAAAACAYAVLTGLPSYFFHPRGLAIERQNRAIALSYYACAPLALAPLLFPVGWALHRIFGQTAGALAAVCLLIVPFVLWWRVLILLNKRGLEQYQPGRTIRIAVGVPILWLVAGGTAEGVVISLLKFVAFVFFSLLDYWQSPR